MSVKKSMWREVWYHVWLEDNHRFSPRACYLPIHGLLTQLTALGMSSALHPIRAVGYPSLPVRVTIPFLLRCRDYLRREDKRTKCKRQFREDCCKPVRSRYDSAIAHELIALWLTAQDLDIVKPGKPSGSGRRAHGVQSLSDEPLEADVYEWRRNQLSAGTRSLVGWLPMLRWMPCASKQTGSTKRTQWVNKECSK